MHMGDLALRLIRVVITEQSVTPREPPALELLLPSRCSRASPGESLPYYYYLVAATGTLWPTG